MYNFFINSKALGMSTGLFESELKQFEPAFERHIYKELEDTAGLLGSWPKKLNLDFFTKALAEFTEGLNALNVSQNRFIEISFNHARFLDSAVHCQYAALYIALIRAENSDNQEELRKINEALKESLARIQAILTQNKLSAQDMVKHDALQIITFVKNLLSGNLLNGNIHGKYFATVGAKKNPGIPNFIQSICRPSTSTKATLYAPQLYLRNLLHIEFSQFKPISSEKTYKKFSHQFTAYYLNLMFIAATINDGRTHFLGLDRISWDAYLSSICIEIAEFFSIENQQGRASPLPNGAFVINKEQAVIFLRDSLQYPPLQTRTDSPVSAGRPTISSPQPIPSPVQRSSSTEFTPIPQTSAATPPRPISIKMAEVLYDYTATNANEISCVVGEQVVLVDPEDCNKIGLSAWVRVQKAGVAGLLPANYLKLS